jgi:hypothetical protein
MFNLLTFLTKGLQNTILVKDNSGLSYNGPYLRVEDEIEIDRWYVGDFCNADYTISIDLDSKNKEIVKCLITATFEDANLVVYSRNYTNISLVEFKVLVNDSYVSLRASPTLPITNGSKLIFSKNMFHTQNPLTL